MLTISILLFAIAAIGGVALAALRLKEKNLPGPLAVAHGVIAAAALLSLIIVVASGTEGTPALVATILFIVAAAGGSVLASFHLSGKVLPIPLMAVHGIVAVAGFVCLLATAVA